MRWANQSSRIRRKQRVFHLNSLISTIGRISLQSRCIRRIYSRIQINTATAMHPRLHNPLRVLRFAWWCRTLPYCRIRMAIILSFRRRTHAIQSLLLNPTINMILHRQSKTVSLTILRMLQLPKQGTPCSFLTIDRVSSYNRHRRPHLHLQLRHSCPRHNQWRYRSRIIAVIILKTVIHLQRVISWKECSSEDRMISILQLALL